MLNLESARQNDELIIVIARITLKSTTEGGRSTALKSGYRPNHCFEKLVSEKKNNFYIGEVQFTNNQECIKPGESGIVTVIFLKAGGIERYLNPGRHWFIYEGSRLVGEGEIIQPDISP